MLATPMSESTAPESNTPAGKLLRWLPILLLIAAVGAAALVGSGNKPGEELTWLNHLAAEGDSGAQLQLGLAYRDGRYGLPVDAKAGFYWLDQAAELGNVYAEDVLAKAYATGQGTGKDLSAAKRWWQKAVDQGDQGARLHLGEELLQEGQVSRAEHYLAH